MMLLLWDTEIAELEVFFTKHCKPSFPTGPAIKLDAVTTILNVETFIGTGLSIVKAQNGKETFRPYLDRLYQLKAIIEPATTI